MIFTPELREQYAILWDGCEVSPSALVESHAIAARIEQSRERYADVSALVNPAMPWHFVALVHQMESSGRFDCHLHNGDPLTARTVHVPIGRPVAGDPPFAWEVSAADALTFRGLHAAGLDWGTPGELYQLERWNGFGYRPHGIPTPYLWAGSDHYTAGKFTTDGHFDPAAVSKQLGAAVILKAILDSAPSTSSADGAAIEHA